MPHPWKSILGMEKRGYFESYSHGRLPFRRPVELLDDRGCRTGVTVVRRLVALWLASGAPFLSPISFESTPFDH